MNDETQAQRLARLTETARKVWPDADVATGRRGRIVSIDSSSVESHFALHVEHERALDAIEAALCAALGEPLLRADRLEQWMEAQWKARAEAPRWAGELAERLLTKAKDAHGSAYYDGYGDALRFAAGAILGTATKGGAR